MVGGGAGFGGNINAGAGITSSTVGFTATATGTGLSLPGGGSLTGVTAGAVTLASASNGNINLNPNGTGVAVVSNTGSAASFIELLRLTNLTTSGGGFLNFNETNSGETPAYIGRYGSTHATRAKVLLVANAETGGALWLNANGNTLIDATYSAPSNAALVVDKSLSGPGSQIQFGDGGFLTSMETHEGMISGGARWSTSSTNWIAVDAHPSIIRLNSTTGGLDFCVDSGLTPGNTFIPTRVAVITTTGLGVMAMGFFNPVTEIWIVVGLALYRRSLLCVFGSCPRNDLRLDRLAVPQE